MNATLLSRRLERLGRLVADAEGRVTRVLALGEVFKNDAAEREFAAVLRGLEGHLKGLWCDHAEVLRASGAFR